MDTDSVKEILQVANDTLSKMRGNVLDVLSLSKPKSVAEIQNTAKIVSKLSPLVGNLIEFRTADFLNANNEFADLGQWVRQDPGFPDVLFKCGLNPQPGIEIKAWFPLATEMTGRFKDSERRFMHDEINLAILAWIPEFLFWGKPKTIGVCVVSGGSVAKARDVHYHNPPHYIVIEPEDTADRTSNLQQSNTNGYVLQEKSPLTKAKAAAMVKRWGKSGLVYDPTRKYQSRLHDLMGAFKYRLDTNYTKIDRIEHAGIEAFKAQILQTQIRGRAIKDWADIIQDIPPDIAEAILSDDTVAPVMPVQTV